MARPNLTWRIALQRALTSLIVLSLLATVGCKQSNQSYNADDGKVLTNPCNKSYNLSDISKPTGVFTSVLTPGAAVNEQLEGGLVRVTWAELEPNPGQFDFSSIEQQLALLPAGKSWSLGIHGGWSSLDEADPDLEPQMARHMSPSWLESSFFVDTFDMEFRNVTVHMPKYWDSNVQDRIESMLLAVAQQYQDDPTLQLVYVPQMTSNGIEGHFNGVPNSTLIQAANIDPALPNAGQLFEEVWVNAALTVAASTANAFRNKAIAFEVHEVIDRVSIPQRIMDGLLQNAEFEHRAGVAMWWLSGKDTYQPDLVNALMQYEGDLYGQIIGNSSQTDRYPNGDFTQVFEQAKSLCMRYIEPWNYEFENNTFNETMADFNEFTAAAFE